MKKTLLLSATALALAIAPAAGVPAFAQTRTPGTTMPGGTAPNKDSTAESARRSIQRLEAAKPIDQMNVSADNLIGAEVRNTRDQKVGSIKDFVMHDGQITSVIIARGGVLGMGTHYHRIEIKQLKVTDDHETAVLDLADAQVKALPEVEWKKGAWVATATGTSNPPNAAPAAPPSTTKPVPAEPEKSMPDHGKTPGDTAPGDTEKK
jgi:hypothetical protein